MAWTAGRTPKPGVVSIIAPRTSSQVRGHLRGQPGVTLDALGVAEDDRADEADQLVGLAVRGRQRVDLGQPRALGLVQGGERLVQGTLEGEGPVLIGHGPIVGPEVWSTVTGHGGLGDPSRADRPGPAVPG